MLLFFDAIRAGASVAGRSVPALVLLIVLASPHEFHADLSWPLNDDNL